MWKARLTVVAVTALLGLGLVPGTAQALPPQNTFVSAPESGQMPNGRSDRPQLSGNGQYVTFDSAATNLDPRDTKPDIDVYRRNLVTGDVELVSVGMGPCPTTSTICNTYSWASDDGNLVAFMSDKPILSTTAVGKKVYLRDMAAGTTEMISVNTAEQRANGPASRPMVSSTGRFVAFSSSATNLSPIGGNGQEQVYLRDRDLGTTTLISVNKDGGPAGSSAGADADESYRGMVSTDGKVVTYSSRAGDIVAGDSNNREDVFIRYVEAGKTVRVSVRAQGATASNGGGTRPYMSPDAQWVMFNTSDPLLPGDTNGVSDVFRYNTVTKTMEMVSVAKDGGLGTADSLRGFISDDGRYAFFNSFSGNLAESDKNGGKGDAFVRDMTTGKTYVLSLSYTGGGLPANSFRPVPSADGMTVTFLSLARNVVANDTSNAAWYQTYAVKTASVLPSTGPTDTTKPVLTVTTPAAGSTNANPVTFSGTATDDVGVSSVDVAIRRTKTDGTSEYLQAGGSTWGPLYRQPATLDGSGAWSLQAWGTLPDGDYTGLVRAIDASGNNVTVTRGFSVSGGTPPPGDTTAPTGTVTSPAAGSTVPSPVTVTGTATDDVAVAGATVAIQDTVTKQWLRPDGVTWGSLYRHPATVTGAGTPSATWSIGFTLPDGRYKAELDVTDSSGNRLATPRPSTTFTVSASG